MTVRNGSFVAKHVQPREEQGSVTNEQIQPNGVDLHTRSIYRVEGSHAYFGDGEYQKPDRTKIEQKSRDGRLPFWELPPGQYIVEYHEAVRIPKGHVGRVYPRSRLMRSGLHLTSALWDQGYEGRGEGLLQIPKGIVTREPRRVEIEVGEPLGQFVLESAEQPDGFSTYDGTHQGERLDE